MTQIMKPSEDLNNLLNLSDEDRRLMVNALNNDNGQSAFQSKYFVANSQYTPYRMVKQCYMEIEARHQSWFDIQNKMKRLNIQIQIAQREKEQEADELKSQLIDLDIETMQYDLYKYERKVTQLSEEMITFLDLAKDIAKDDTSLLDTASGYNEEEEQKYWQIRMSKQAAMDMVSYGRIGTGNMDSIALMSEEDQINTLARTLQYTERLTQGMGAISNAVNEGLLQHKENMPHYDVPKITDNLLAEKLIEDVQRTSESKTKSESI